ncbi:MAG: HAD family hydrolase [Firmicutes bacterium]|nr:HAD family hydrolase [Bacillota bacterium]
MKLQALGFDLDGTLWDSTVPVTITWRRIFEEQGLPHLPTEADIQGIMGLSAAQIAAKLLPELDPAEGLALVERCCLEEQDTILQMGGRLYPEVPETLARLGERLPLFIVSNCEPGYIESFLTYHKLGEFFADTENLGRTGLTKAGNIRLVMRRNGWENTAYLGDTEWDQAAAVEAGVPFLHAAFGFGHAVGRVPELAAFADLPDLLTELELW